MKIGLFKNKSFSDGSIATYWKVNVASINNEFNFVKVEVVGYKDKAQYTLNKRGYIKESRIERIWSGTDYEAFEAGMAATANLYDMVYTKLIESVIETRTSIRSDNYRC